MSPPPVAFPFLTSTKKPTSLAVRVAVVKVSVWAPVLVTIYVRPRIVVARATVAGAAWTTAEYALVSYDKALVAVLNSTN
jgi:hypothetical protein